MVKKQFKAVLVANGDIPIPEWFKENLAKEGIDLSIGISWNKEDLARNAGDADLVWDNAGSYLLRGENLEVLKSCRAIVRTGSGVDNVDVEAATRLGIIVANTPEAVTEPVSDHAIGLLFSVVRQIPPQDSLVKKGQWNAKIAFPGRHYRSATLGLVGFGRIAQMVTRKLMGFEMKILAYDPYVSPKIMQELGVQSVELEELLKQSDFISLHCPFTRETHHLIGEEELRMMRPEAILINTSRGSVVDERALYRALKEGWIAGAGLDVLEKEPPDPKNPILQLDNVVITPHMASYSDLYPSAELKATFQTIVDFARGRWPRSVVNREVKAKWKLV